MDARVGKRYARALFQAALAGNTIDSVEADLGSIKSLVENDRSLKSFLLSPNVARDEKIRIAGNLFSDRVTALTMQVVRLMLAKRREHEIPSLYDQFVELRRAHQEVMSVTVTSAFELDESQKTRLIDRITQKSGRKIEPTFRVDRNLIGGVRVQFGDYVVDGSLSGALSRLKNHMRLDVLKQAVEI